MLHIEMKYVVKDTFGQFHYDFQFSNPRFSKRLISSWFSEESHCLGVIQSVVAGNGHASIEQKNHVIIHIKTQHKLVNHKTLLVVWFIIMRRALFLGITSPGKH